MTAKEFWDFFESIEAPLRIEFELKDPYASPTYEILGRALEDYSKGLSWVHYKDRKRYKHVLIVTTGCNQDYFLAASNLVENAPRFIHWEFQALVPAMITYDKSFLKSEFYLDGIPIKMEHLKVALACINDDGTYVLAFLLPFVFRNKDVDRLYYDLQVLLEHTMGERRYTQIIEFIIIDFDDTYNYEYTTLDKADKYMLEHEAWLSKKRQLEASKFKSEK